MKKPNFKHLNLKRDRAEFMFHPVHNISQTFTSLT